MFSLSLSPYYRNAPMRALTLAAAGVAAAFLSVALISQYGFGLHPCDLCIYQRVPYAVIVVIGAAAGGFLRRERRRAAVVLLCASLFVLDAGIAVYHGGVERGFIQGPSACTNNYNPQQTLEEMRRAIVNAPLVPCDQPMGYVLGLSMAEWNAVAATFSAVALVYGWARLRPRRL